MQIALFSPATLPGSITNRPVPQSEQDLVPVFGKEVISGQTPNAPYRYTDWYGRYGSVQDYTVHVYGYIDDAVVLGKIQQTGRIDEFGVFSLFPTNQ